MDRCTLLPSFRRRNAIRRGFTLIELMVTIAIIAIVCAIAIVAIQKVRGASAQTACMNNLKQIVLATQNYYDANERLPPGYNKQTLAGVLLYLTPYLDENLGLKMPAPLMKGAGGNWWTQFPNNGLGDDSPVSARLPNFECPSAALYTAAYANGTVKYEVLGGGGGSTQLTLRQMLASSDSSIRALGQKIADNLNQIYYAVWCSQVLVWEISDFGAKQGTMSVPLDGGSVTVTGGAGSTSLGHLGGIFGIFDWFFQTYSGGSMWMTSGSFTINGQRFDVNLNKSLFLSNKKGVGVRDLTSYVAPGYNIVLPGHYYDNPAGFTIYVSLRPLIDWEGEVEVDFWTNQEMRLILRNSAPITNEIWPIAFGTPTSPNVKPQDNPLFWAYYDATYSATYTYSIGGAPPGFALVPHNPIDATMGRTSYVGNAGTYGFSSSPTLSSGPFFPDSAVTYNDISDGLSSTIAFGESLGGPEGMSRAYALTWMGAGVLPSYWDCQSPSTWFTFASGHVSGVNFAMCDGSVRTINKVAASANDLATGAPAAKDTPRWAVFQQLAGMSDGQTPDLTKLD